jgi:hypothetical protein
MMARVSTQVVVEHMATIGNADVPVSSLTKIRMLDNLQTDTS